MSLIKNKPFYVMTINGVPINTSLFYATIEIEMDSSFIPDTFKVKIYNMDELTQTIVTKNSIVSISIGYETYPPINIITGVITYINNYNENNDSIIEIQGIDYVSYQLKKTTINLSLNIPTDVIEICRQIALRCGVILSPYSIASGIILPNYSVNKESAYSELERLSKRIGFNITSKLSQLFITRTIISPIPALPITDASGFYFFKSSGLKQNAESNVNGYSFKGNGDPTLVPMKTLSVTLTESLIFGTYVIESVKHVYNNEGYSCIGNVIEIKQDAEIVNIISKTTKTLANIVNKKIIDTIQKQSTLDTGIIEQIFKDNQLFTFSIGLDEATNQSIVNKSIESRIGVNNVYVNKKPVMSSFTGNGFGLISPIYQGTRCVLGFNRFDKQDINILGCLWDKNWTIPAHDTGDWLLHHKNHSKIAMKEDGSAIHEVKSLKIVVGNNGLTISKPTKTDDGKLLITFDDNSELSYKQGDGWTLNTTGEVNIGANATSIKFAGGGHKLSHDTHTHDLTATHTHPFAHVHQVISIGAPTGPATPAATSPPTSNDTAQATSDNTTITEAE